MKQAKIMDKITYILPIHEFNDTISEMLTNAFKSLKGMTNKGKLFIIGPKDVINKVSDVYSKCECKQKAELIENDETDLYKQINKAVMQCRTKYFCVFEYDDLFTENWFNDFENYESTHSIYLPLVETYKDYGKIIGFSNEIVWSASFADEDKMGQITLDNLMQYMDYNLSGTIIKTEDFISIGGLKASLKIAAWYEYLLRTCYNSLTVYVVPKIGYQHMVAREGSYTDIANKAINDKEGVWLIETARQEYFFKEDRNKAYTEESEDKKEEDVDDVNDLK